MNPILTETNASPQSIADYLAQLLKDRKQLAALPNVFTHLERLLDEGKSKFWLILSSIRVFFIFIYNNNVMLWSLNVKFNLRKIILLCRFRDGFSLLQWFESQFNVKSNRKVDQKFLKRRSRLFQDLWSATSGILPSPVSILTGSLNSIM